MYDRGVSDMFDCTSFLAVLCFTGFTWFHVTCVCGFIPLHIFCEKVVLAKICQRERLLGL